MQDILIQELERIRFKLSVEAKLQSDPDAARRLGHIALETEDTLEKAREILDLPNGAVFET